MISCYHDIAVSEFRVLDVVSIISVHDVLDVVSYAFEGSLSITSYNSSSIAVKLIVITAIRYSKCTLVISVSR
jgi:hypothetical protein